MKTKFSWILAVIVMLVVMAGCGQKEYTAQAINEATDKCVICNMQVKDDAFAVQLTTKEGKTYKFDDIGCMNEWKKENGTDQIAAQFVRDYNTKEWIKFDEATYAFDVSFKSPMAYGIYSFKDKTEAQSFIDSQKKGMLMSAAELSGHTWERGKGMGGSHGHSHSESGAAPAKHGQ
ncbi:nitrous oxide reductase accessory protein NosL [Paenibacillus sp. YYML68]|uniref:nitrous oxide reductase accessory protein NosL n=1 Tax=Paenibacillus sp. YYML68 TaxID=2909250 RepID=UPI00248FB907|nr:nitrous oxide reductase accessory protein NosL [Paenibacillus sp. YYML68]